MVSPNAMDRGPHTNETSTPNYWKIWPRLSTSDNLRTSFSTFRPDVNKAAAINAKPAFLELKTCTSPMTSCPSSIIRALVLAEIDQCCSSWVEWEWAYTCGLCILSNRDTWEKGMAILSQLDGTKLENNSVSLVKIRHNWRDNIANNSSRRL